MMEPYNARSRQLAIERGHSNNAELVQYCVDYVALKLLQLSDFSSLINVRLKRSKSKDCSAKHDIYEIMFC